MFAVPPEDVYSVRGEGKDDTLGLRAADVTAGSEHGPSHRAGVMRNTGSTRRLPSKPFGMMADRSSSALKDLGACWKYGRRMVWVMAWPFGAGSRDRVKSSEISWDRCYLQPARVPAQTRLKDCPRSWPRWLAQVDSPF